MLPCLPTRHTNEMECVGALHFLKCGAPADTLYLFANRDLVQDQHRESASAKETTDDFQPERLGQDACESGHEG